MDIRRATVADAALLARLNDHVHALHVAAEPEIYRPTVLAEVEDWMRARLGPEGGAEVLVAHEGDVALGYAVYREIRRPGHAFLHPLAYVMVDEIAVVPGDRRTGVGRALMDAVADRARELGVAEVQLDVRAHNRDAAAFYAALGYAEVRRTLALRLV
jgi:ribosomal protein S18 acetylase RimI-like enzyme